jgi:hypothetical protein
MLSDQLLLLLLSAFFDESPLLALLPFLLCVIEVFDMESREQVTSA